MQPSDRGILLREGSALTGSRWCRVGSGCQAKGSGKAAPRRWPGASGLCCSSPDSTEDTRGQKQQFSA